MTAREAAAHCAPSFYTFYRDAKTKVVKGKRTKDRKRAQAERAILQGEFDGRYAPCHEASGLFGLGGSVDPPDREARPPRGAPTR